MTGAHSMFGTRVWRCAVTAAVVLCAVVFAARPARAQSVPNDRWENGVTEAWRFDADRMTAEEIERAKSRWTEIGGGQQAGDEWAGVYHSGNTVHGSYVRWSARGSYVLMSVYLCEARVLGAGHGEVFQTSAGIQFLPGLVHAQQTEIFIPVKWRGVHYLIPEKQLSDFMDYAAGLGAYNYGLAGNAPAEEEEDFFYKVTDKEAGAADELPAVPPGYERFVKSPVDATVTAVGRARLKRVPEDEWWAELITPVTISAGRADGVRRGMTLFVLGSRDRETVEVREVGARTSQGVIVRSVRRRPGVKTDAFDDGRPREYRKIEAGWSLSTSYAKYLAALPPGGERF